MTKPSSKTVENLIEAFALEAQSIRRYLYFAAKADSEGFNDVAAVFRQIAESERAAADEMLALLDAAEDTRAALEAAIASESASSAKPSPPWPARRAKRARRRLPISSTNWPKRIKAMPAGFKKLWGVSAKSLVSQALRPDRHPRVCAVEPIH